MLYLPDLWQTLALPQERGAWVWVWTRASLLSGAVFIAVGSLLVLMAQLVYRNRNLFSRLNRCGLAFFGLYLIAIAFIAFANLMYYQFYAPTGWAELRSNLPAIHGVVVGIWWFLLLSPLLLTWWRPAIAYSPWMARAFDVFVMLSGIPFFASGMLEYRGFPLCQHE
jgi:hypothetical protein